MRATCVRSILLGIEPGEIVQDSELVAIELKAASQASPRDADGIRAFAEGPKNRAKLKRGVVLYGGSPRPLGPNVLALPYNWAFPRTSLAREAFLT
jgi:hypothetical protein